MPFRAEREEAGDDPGTAKGEGSLEEGGIADHFEGDEAEGEGQGAGGEDQGSHGSRVGWWGIDGKPLGAKRVFPGDEGREEGVEGIAELGLAGAEVVHGAGDDVEGGVAGGDAIEDLLQAGFVAVVAEPVVGDAGVDAGSEGGRQPVAVGELFAVDDFQEVGERLGVEVRPAAGQEVVEADVDEGVGEAAEGAGEAVAGGEEGRKVIGEAVDGPVADDAGDDFGRQVDGFGPAGDEIAEQVADPRGSVFFGEEEVGEVVHR